MKPAILEISHLGIQRSGTVILHDVSWRISHREHWVVLGANGSGKTSLLSALTGYLMPTSGEIMLLNHRYGESDWRKLRQKIGLVSSSIRQRMADAEPAFETIISGKYAMIDFWGRPCPADRRRAEQILKQIECTALRDRPWGVLSQGERQRVLIGRALMANPQLLILDEPCAGLDPAAREQFLAFIERLGRRRSGPTLILVTHHVEEIMPVFSHVLLLGGGKVLAAGTRGDVLTSANLARTFHARVRLTFSGRRYQLKVTPRSGSVI